MEQLMNQNEE